MRPTLRDRRFVRGLVDWLTGGLATRLEFVERDLTLLEARAQRLAKEPTDRACPRCGAPQSRRRTEDERGWSCPNRCADD